MSKEEQQISEVHSRKITEEMRESYIDYAMSVIVSRALPDVRDGLKPVQRRILYTMYKMGLTAGASFRKSATIVGRTMGRYHPHGDQAIYNTLVRMAQDFSLRYPLVQGQGNFGSIDGDPAAASRYSEARLSRIGQEMLSDIRKDTVDFVDNFDATRQEPKVLPSPVPQLLINGCLGIAVGTATNIPPHNLKEVVQASIHLIDHPQATTKDLFEYIQGPDFPGGGIIFDKKGLIEAYSKGSGPILMRGTAEISEQEGQTQIIITEIPYQINKADLVESFAELVKKDKLKGVKDIRDESGKEGMRIVLDISRGRSAQKILNRLYKFSRLQTKFHLNAVALVEGIQPRLLSLKEILKLFIEHRRKVVTRRTEFELEQAQDRAHILEGLEIALKNIDQVIEIIRESESADQAQDNLMEEFDLTEVQAEAILDMRLSSLAQLEREKVEQELEQKKELIEELSEILGSEEKIKEIVKQELEQVKEEYGDQRRTELKVRGIEEIPEQDLVPHKKTIITMTQGGYIKRISPRALRRQKRGGKGVLGMRTKGKDVVTQFLLAKTLDTLLFFTDSGKVFQTTAYEVPKRGRVAKGKPVSSLIDISSKEKVLSLIRLRKEHQELGINYLVMATKNGIVKKSKLEDFENIRKSGLIAIDLKKGDQLRVVGESSGEDQIMLITKQGLSIRFEEEEARAMGRTASGVIGQDLKKGDQVVAMEVIKSKIKNQKSKKFLLVVTENGYGKKTELGEYKVQGRGGVGLKTAKIKDRTGSIVGAKIVSSEEDLVVISEKGKVIRTDTGSISVLGRNTQGVRVMKLDKGDKVASIAVI